MADEVETARDHIIIGDNVYYKHPTHWYSDGNVILLVQDKAIKVYQGIIDRRSPVLQKVLGLPNQSSSTLQTSGDVVTIPLEANLSDFSFLLDTIMPQTCATPRISPDSGWSSLVGLIQVAQNYQVDDVATRAVKVLEDVLPTIQYPDQNTSVYDDPEAAVQVINFARDCRTPQFLTPAFYALSTKDWTDYPHPSSPLTRLSNQDQMRVQQGRMRLQSAVIEMALGRWENVNGYRAYKTCPHNDGGCWGGWGDGVWPKADDVRRWRNLLWHPLEELKQRVELPEHRYICTGCRDEFVAENKRMRVELIDKLATIFSLDDDEAGIDRAA